MASCPRNFGLASLLIISSAVVLSVSCSSATKKKVVLYAADGGAAGETAIVVAGDAGAGGNDAGAAGTALEAGAGGAGGASEAGAGGALEAGAGGALGEGGSAGVPQVSACEQSGSLTGASFKQFDDTPVVCRGSTIRNGFNGSAAADFSCCAAFASVPTSAFAVSGVTNNDGGGYVNLTVPANAPLGRQTLDVSCPDSDGVSLSPALQIVTPAVVTGIDASIHQGETLTIMGTDFDSVSNISLKDGEVTRACSITSRTATTLTCVPQYTGLFWVELSQGSCYPVADKTLKVTILPAT